jgi:hypothetical protein
MFFYREKHHSDFTYEEEQFSEVMIYFPKDHPNLLSN